MAEFFVLKRFRRTGVGRTAAYALFDRFPGRWYISQLKTNTPAQAFWRAVVDEYTAGRYQERIRAGSGNTLQLFDTRAGC
ncbi:hypothetical protein [Paenibacillus pinistramenti]|uniref:hypothetical protein n=1 Tax=Paenibacillus pinistramenti TaxID=1768003 RepID=UPI001EF0FBF3|nr:hypothetical protein [Paenibacillus pinistramenti]